MTTAQAIAAAVTFVWFGMVLAISFLETPLKFRAPGGPVRVGLGIDRLVFRVVNRIEIVWATILLVAVIIDMPPTGVVVAANDGRHGASRRAGGVRPRLTRCSDQVLAGEDGPRFRWGRPRGG
nr:hypothetical protein [Rhodococcus wratislaviensis]GLK41028.1 hypothetical protein GCM10017611_79030 [Rhodococcus wratislaviensis]